MENLIYWTVLVAGFLLAAIFYLRSRNAREVSGVAALKAAELAGLTEPASLHPVVDPTLCFGSGACARACPEEAIGIVNGRAALVSPALCIGHGACAAACPAGAISLVFGTARRGMDIPAVAPNFETNVPGIFIAGELGGMGLIRKAVEQGVQAMRNIAKRPRGKADYDVIVVGAGPAGIAATLAAREAGLRYLTIEQEETLGGTALHYPRRKIVMTAPMNLPLIGKIPLREISKEALIDLWHDVVRKSRIEIAFGTRLDRLEAQGGAIRMHTSKGEFRASSALLAIGRRGTPRRLGAPGEELPKVLYRLIEPEQFRGTSVLVVGGGDSALEAALSLAGEPGTRVTLAYRGEAFNRVKAANRERLDAARRSGAVDVRMNTEVGGIARDTVTLTCNGQTETIANDAIIVCAGGILPMGMLKDAGIRVDTRHGE